MKNHYLCNHKTAIVLWCNGSTTGFGSVCGGSNPPRTTQKTGNGIMLFPVFFVGFNWRGLRIDGSAEKI